MAHDVYERKLRDGSLAILDASGQSLYFFPKSRIAAFRRAGSNIQAAEKLAKDPRVVKLSETTLRALSELDATINGTSLRKRGRKTPTGGIAIPLRAVCSAPAGPGRRTYWTEEIDNCPGDGGWWSRVVAYFWGVCRNGSFEGCVD